MAKAKAVNTHIKTTGIVGGFGMRVRITGYGARANEYVPAGSVGILEPIEMSVDGDVLCARFYKCDGGRITSAPGLVTWPKFESVDQHTFRRIDD